MRCQSEALAHLSSTLAAVRVWRHADTSFFQAALRQRPMLDAHIALVTSSIRFAGEELSLVLGNSAVRRPHSCSARAGTSRPIYSDEPLLLEAGGFSLELHLSVIPNCADLALSQALWTFMRQLFRLFQLVPLQRPALLAPAIISALGYPNLTGRIGNAPTLRDQYVNLLQLRGNVFRFVSLPRHV